MEEVARWRETAAKNDGGESSSQNTRKSRKHLCTKENVSTESRNKIVNEYACARMRTDAAECVDGKGERVVHSRDTVFHGRPRGSSWIYLYVSRT